MQLKVHCPQTEHFDNVKRKDYIPPPLHYGRPEAGGPFNGQH